MCVILATIFLVYCKMLVPPLYFWINCLLERVALDLSHPPTLTLTLPPPSLSVTLPACGVGSWLPLPLAQIPPPPPPKKVTVSWEICGWWMRTAGGSLTSHTHSPHSSHPPSTDFSADLKLVGWPTVIEREGWGLGVCAAHRTFCFLGGCSIFWGKV